MPRMSVPSGPPSRFRVLDADRPAIMLTMLLVAGAALAVSSLVGDSMTFDELDQITGGTSYWETGDFRLAPGNPPLAKMWATLPVYLLGSRWRQPDPDLWRESKLWRIGHAWLFPGTAGEDLVTRARLMVVPLYGGLVLTCFAAARRIFGPKAGLLAAVLAALSPELLAHGRLVTTDLPVTFLFALALLTFARFAERTTLPRFFAAAASLAALSLTKFSWPLVIPALAVIAVAAVLRTAWSRPDRGGSPGPAPTGEIAAPCGHQNPPDARFCTACGQPLAAPAPSAPHAAATSRKPPRGPAMHAAVLAAASVALAACVWAAVWTCYHWRFSPFNGVSRDQATMFAVAIGNAPAPTTMDGAWDTILKDAEGRELEGLTASFIRAARRGRWLPEAYLYGLATVLRPSADRSHYLRGETYKEIRPGYFAWTVWLKTPLPTMLLAVAGLAVVLLRFRDVRDAPLLAGLLTFAVLYALYASFSAVNIGHRHILPIYPALYVLASAVAASAAPPLVRRLSVLPAIWLAGVTVTTHPHYLGYFNELAGGWRNAWRYLADSNIDWGQDLKRLAAYTRAHPAERIKLAYFGSAKPDQYGFPVEMLPSSISFARPAQLDPGTYVVSVTQSLGVYPSAAFARDSFWREQRNRDAYRRAADIVRSPPPEGAAAAENRARAQRLYEAARVGLLLHRLATRPPDDFVGRSLRVHRLSAADIEQLTRLDDPATRPAELP